MATAPQNQSPGIFNFFGSLRKTNFAKEISKRTLGFVGRGINHAVFGAGMGITSFGLSVLLPLPIAPIAAIAGGTAVGLGIRHRQNKTRKYDQIRSTSRKGQLTATIIAGSLIGGVIIGPVIGSAIGATIGRIFASPIIKSLSKPTLGPRGGPLNRFTRITSNATSFISFNFNHKTQLLVPVAIGCLSLASLAIFILLFVIPGIFLISNKTSGPSTPPEDLVTSEGCPTIWPTDSRTITQGPHNTYSHPGLEAIDIRASEGTPVLSVTSGKVIHAGWWLGYGNRVVIESKIDQDTNYQILYAHLSEIHVSKNDPVGVSQQIGLSGSTSSKQKYRVPHLHFEYLDLPYSRCPLPGSGTGQPNVF